MKLNSPIHRIYLFGVMLTVVAAVFFFRLMQMQIVDNDTYIAYLTRGSSVDQTLTAARGEILDRYGRPLAVNRIGFDLQLSRALLPRGQENATILQIITLLQTQNEDWTDTLPITSTAPYTYIEDGQVTPESLRRFLGLGEYASADDAMYWLTRRYGLDDFGAYEGRAIAGIRYEMERQGWNISQPYTLATGISIETVSLIKQLSLDLPGVQVEETAYRYYDEGVGSIAPHVVGRVGPLFQEEYDRLKEEGYRLSDQIGKDGIEQAFESELRGDNGVRRIYLDATGRVDTVEDVQPPVPGNTVVLTIDSEMQKLATESLKNRIAYLNANAVPGQGREADTGAVVALDIKTGEVLALVTYPSYDLSTFATDYSDLVAPGSGYPLFNRALSGQYAPGSCFKPVVGLAGLNEDVITTTSTVYCSSRYTLASAPDHAFTCLSAHGNYTLREAIRESCNIFFYDTGRQLGIDTINDYAQQLGLGVKTGIELGEFGGSQSVDNPERPGDTLQTAIGQMGNAYSPLQLANYVATIARRGVRMDVSIIKRISSYNYERVVYEHEPSVSSVSRIDDEHFTALIAGMVDASHIGTARATFAGYPIQVASKTGTPQTIEFPNSVFIAYAPVDDPQIAVAVVIEKGWHGYTGAPVARDIFDYYFFGGANTENAGSVGSVQP